MVPVVFFDEKWSSSFGVGAGLWVGGGGVCGQIGYLDHGVQEFPNRLFTVSLIE
jgi:hypothetical protein